MYPACLEKETDLLILKQESISRNQPGFLGVLGETLGAQYGALEDHGASKHLKSNVEDLDRRYEQAELTIDEGI